MSGRRWLRLLHLGATGWFMLCASYVLIIMLRQAGAKWWIIFSLSGYSALAAFLFTSLYLFAIFKGTARNQKAILEHPLTASACYMVLYYTSPFFGAFAGSTVAGYRGDVTQDLLTIALGSFVMTFLIWIVIDPAIVLIETMLPASRAQCRLRRAQARAVREERQRRRQLLLVRAESMAESERLRWQSLLRPQAEELASVLTNAPVASAWQKDQLINIGMKAWQMGGLGCMKQLHDMAIDIARRREQGRGMIDYMAVYWDGIGQWRYHSLEEAIL